MLPKKILLHPVLGGEGEPTDRADKKWPSCVLAAASTTGPEASAGDAAPRGASKAAAASSSTGLAWMKSVLRYYHSMLYHTVSIYLFI